MSNKIRAQYIYNLAKQHGYTIPFPITVHEYLLGDKLRGNNIIRDGILIDDAAYVIGQIFNNVTIHEMTFTDYGDNIINLETEE